MNLTTTDKRDIKDMINDGTKETVKRVSNLEVIAGETYKRLTSIETRLEENSQLLSGVEFMVEDTNFTVKQMLGMLSDDLKVKPQVDNHEIRITDIETIQPMLVSTVALHSKQLKT